MTDTLRPVEGIDHSTDPPPYLLPPEAYYDQAWFEHEQRELFGRTWNLVAYESDLPEPGDHVAVQVGLDPVLLIRGDDGVVRAFLNMCRHRGMALVCEAAGTGATVRCPYHGWEYATDGALVRIPQRASQFPDLDPAQWGLVPLGVGTWDGMVFVNPDSSAEPFESWLGVLPDRVGPFDTTQLAEVFRLRSLFLGLGVLPFMLPPVISAVGALVFWNRIGNVGQIENVIIAHGVFFSTVPLVTIALGLDAIDPSIGEAATTLGADPRTRFQSVTLPLLTPSIVTGFVATMVLSLNEYIIAFMVAGFTVETLPIKIFNALRYGFTPTIAAVSVVFTVLSLAALTLLARIGGLERLLGTDLADR